MYQLPLLKPETSWRPPSEFPSFAGAKRLAFDLETKDEELLELGPGVRRPGNYIVGLSFRTDDGRGGYYPIRHLEGGNLDPAMVLRWARAECKAFEGEVVGARLIYDLDWAAGEEIAFDRAKRFLDVQIAEPLIDENLFEYNLNSLARRYLGETKREDLLREAALAYGVNPKGGLWRLPAEYVGAYGEGDTELPLRILEMQEKIIKEQDLGVVWDMETRLIPILLAMKRRGVRVDVDRIAIVRRKLVEERERILAILRREGGPKVELMEPMSFLHVLKDHGIPVPLTPKTQQPSVTKVLLERYAHDPFIATLWRGRKLQTVINTFLDGLLKHIVNGRVHTEFNQLKGDDSGTIARFSSSNPNLQNIPARDEELGPLVRSVFVPEEDERWRRYDESQIEYRFLAHYAIGPSGEECRAKYNADPKTDYHAMTAEIAKMDPTDKFIRKRVKNVNFGKVYGSGVKTMANTMGASEAEAEAFIKEYDRRLPFVSQTFNKAMRRASERGYVVTHLGRRQRFDLWEPADDRKKPALPRARAEKEYGPRIKRAFTYAALNRILQGSAADALKKAMVDIWESGVCDQLGVPELTVHDELDFSEPAGSEEAVAEVKHMMETCVKLRVPLIADTEVGANWGEAS